MKAAIWADNPPPSFSQKAGLECSARVAKPSHEAIAFLRQLLTRSPSERPSAETALKADFFGQSGSTDAARGSLRPMLFAARRAGAFDAPASKNQAATEVDLRLAAQQE